MPYAVAVVQPNSADIVVIVIDAPTPAAAIDVAKSRGFEIADDTARPVIGTGARLAMGGGGAGGAPPVEPGPIATAGAAAGRDNPSWWTIARGVYVGMMLVAATSFVLMILFSCILTGSLFSGLKSVAPPPSSQTPRGSTFGRP